MARLVVSACLVAGGLLLAQQPSAPTAPPPSPAQGRGGSGRGQGPLTVPAGGFFFVQLSDTQFGFSNNDADFIQDTASAEFAVATINRLKPAFVIVTGDLVNKPGDAAQIAEYQRIMAKVDRTIPVYSVPGNHDIENEPTPATLAAYRKTFGRDYYTFRHAQLLGIVLNSTVIHSPQHVAEELAAQDRWLRGELQRAAASTDTRHIVIFQHHPYFLEKADEADQYFNLPQARRAPLLALFHQSGVRMLVAGHLHRSTEAADGDLPMVVTGPVSRPLGGGQSGFRVFVVTDTAITHRYYAFGELPYRISTLTPRRPAAR